MAHTLTLEVAEEIYQPLLKTAAQTGQTPEALAEQWLANAVRHFIDDPLEEFIGALPSEVPNWTEQHDHYIGRALLKETRGEQSEEGRDA
jgi:hypothetical protein